MRGKFLVFGLITLLLLVTLSTVNAEISISQPKTVYNLGETLSVDITLDSLKQSYLDINLNCDSVSENLYHNVPDTTKISIKRQLIPAYIQNSLGQCYIEAVYDSESQQSQGFEITSDIIVNLEANNMSYYAGDSLNIKGSAVKQGSDIVNAFVEVTIGDSLSSSSIVTNGKFNVNFSLPINLRANNYIVNVKVYDKSGEDILNSGQATDSLMVKQKPAKIDVALDKQTINPGEDLQLIPFLYDYAGDNYDSKVLMKVEDPMQKSLFEGYVTANSNVTIKTQTNSTPGLNNIIIQKDEIVTEKQFSINSVKNISVQISKQIMLITNIGNIPYKGIIEIGIGNESVLKDINLAVNENKSFEISAPDGVYNITIKDDANVYSQSSLSLTGNVISINEVGDKITSVFVHYPIVWLFVVVIVVLFIWVSYKKYEDYKKFNFAPSEGRRRNLDFIKKKGGIEIVNPEMTRQVIDSAILQGDIRKAEQVLSLHGISQQAGIVAIKMKTPIAGIVKDSLRKALEYGYKLKGVSHQAGDYIILIFTPMLTKSKDNEERAIKAAIDIDNFLREHNRKFRRDVVNYGIGINSGQIINKLEGSVLQFASISKTISQAKKIAEISNQEVLLSKEAHEKTSANIKVEKFASGAMDLYTVKRVIDTEKSQKFISEFLRRA